MQTSATTRRSLLGALGALALPGCAIRPETAAPPRAAAFRDTLALRPGAPFQPSLFRSFFLGGFECSTHRRADGRRLDLIAATRHNRLAGQDYRQLAGYGIRSVRDGLRWHLVESAPGRYDWSSVLPMLRAAEGMGLQVAWDLCHYGWPDDLDVFSAAFVDRFARFAGAFARLHLAETGRPPMVCPVNEISFLAWAGGDKAWINPMRRGHGRVLKRQLVRAAIAATHAVRAVAPDARILAIDPMIHVVPRKGQAPRRAAAYTELQFQAWDMLAGRRDPELGGGPEMLDVIGVNYYWNNQWEDRGAPVTLSDPRHRPMHAMLAAVHARYARPIFLAETSIEGEDRAAWLRYIGQELRTAMRAGVPVEGCCLYPVLSHPGWDDDRYCANGLLEMEPDGAGGRVVHAPLVAELRRQQELFVPLLSGSPAVQV